MKDKHLTSQSGHAIINGFYEGNGSRRALIYKDDNDAHNVELWKMANSERSETSVTITYITQKTAPKTG